VDAFPTLLPLKKPAGGGYPTSRRPDWLVIWGMSAKRLFVRHPTVHVMLELVCAGLLVATAGRAEPRKVIRSADDLPRFTYQAPASAEQLITEDSKSFAPFLASIRTDVDHVLENDHIADRATMRGLLETRFEAQILAGLEDEAALKTLDLINTYDDKPVTRLVGNVRMLAYIQARMAAPGSGQACPAGFGAALAKLIAPMPWPVVGTELKKQRTLFEFLTRTFMIGMANSKIQPAIDKDHAVSGKLAWEIISDRVNLQVSATCSHQAIPVLTAYIKAHDVKKPGIWAARDVTLAPDQHLTPVNVGIWDSGFDPALFKNNLIAPSKDGNEDAFGIAYDELYHPAHGALIPLTAEQKAAYPGSIRLMQGVSDLMSNIDSPEAAATRKEVAAMPPAESQKTFEQMTAFSGYAHGTHVTGIAARGNPFIRLAYGRMTYDLKPIHTPPSDALEQRVAASYAQTISWFRAHHIRVVNMSFYDKPSAYEADLEANGIGRDAEDRKRLARHYFQIGRDAFYTAIKNTPDILFVTIAGNDNDDNAFAETVPSSFVLPNLIVAGAVDDAGERTSFTSAGKNVAVYADGAEVDSVVPGGAHVRLSGTSMAAPQVTNLAAKLIATKPSLTPPQTIHLIVDGADPATSPGIRLMNPKRSMEMLLK
jgi:hypothetical protein